MSPGGLNSVTVGSLTHFYHSSVSGITCLHGIEGFRSIRSREQPEGKYVL